MIEDFKPLPTVVSTMVDRVLKEIEDISKQASHEPDDFLVPQHLLRLKGMGSCNVHLQLQAILPKPHLS